MLKESTFCVRLSAPLRVSGYFAQLLHYTVGAVLEVLQYDSARYGTTIHLLIDCRGRLALEQNPLLKVAFKVGMGSCCCRSGRAKKWKGGQ